MTQLERRENRPGPVDAAIAHSRQLQLGGKWPEATVHLTQLLSGELQPIEMTAVLNERAVTYRVPGNYTAAEADFNRARIMAVRTGDLEGEVTAVVGLLDLARTAEYAKGYQKGKDLQLAQVLRTNAEAVLQKMPEGWSVGKINALTQFGLLDHELGKDKEAIGTYTEAEEGCKVLLSEQPNDTYLQNRLIRTLHLKALAQNALGQVDEAITSQTEVLEVYKKLGDVRGIANTSLALARAFRGINNLSAARVWYEKVVEASERKEGEKTIVVDEIMYEEAKKELAELNSQ